MDGGVSPHIRHVKECLTVIEEIEEKRFGTNGYKALNYNEKYKIALLYMKMLQNPDKFSNMERYLPPSEKENDEKS